MSEKLDDLAKQIEEISKLDLAEQPKAFSELYEQLNQELNSGEEQAQ